MSARPQIMRPGMTNAEYLKALRADAAARGLCYVCRARFPRPGNRSCDHCITRSNESRANAVASGVCYRCTRRKRSLSSQECATCAAKYAAKARADRARRKASGQCGRHGCPHSAAPGRSSCFAHLKEIADRARRLYHGRVADGLCTYFGCYKPPADGHVKCLKHNDAENKRQRMRRP